MSATLCQCEMISLQLTVNNHPGVMSHVCGLFARRAFNLEGIVVTPIGEGATCSIWLIMRKDHRLDQIVKQVSKLQDVLEVGYSSLGDAVFEHLASCMEQMQV